MLTKHSERAKEIEKSIPELKTCFDKLHGILEIAAQGKNIGSKELASARDDFQMVYNKITLDAWLVSGSKHNDED